jgi:hypothetical protein
MATRRPRMPRPPKGIATRGELDKHVDAVLDHLERAGLNRPTVMKLLEIANTRGGARTMASQKKAAILQHSDEVHHVWDRLLVLARKTESALATLAEHARAMRERTPYHDGRNVDAVVRLHAEYLGKLEASVERERSRLTLRARRVMPPPVLRALFPDTDMPDLGDVVALLCERVPDLEHRDIALLRAWHSRDELPLDEQQLIERVKQAAYYSRHRKRS